MKKTLIAAAALTAMAASAMAADVTLYGVVDTGLKFTQTKKDGAKTKNALVMADGIAGGNRWGVKGTESLSKNYKFGFVLEGGMSTDTGAFGDEYRIFNRQAEINITGPFGKLAFGRMGTITGGTNGGIMLGKMSGFGTAYSGLGNVNALFNQAAGLSRVDNAWRYDTPKMAGFQLTVQYSDCTDQLKEEDDEALQTEGTSQSVSYAGIVAQYAHGPFEIYLGADQIHQGKLMTRVGEKNTRSYDLATSYNFGPAKLYLAYQHNTDLGWKDGVDSDVYQISADIKAGTGKVKTTIGYKDGDEASESKAWRLGVGYEYPFSKRTFFFAAAGYKDAKTSADVKTKTLNVAAGLHHSF